MRAKCLRGFRRAGVWLASVGVLVGGCLCLQAGERIEIGRERSKFEPPKESKLGQDLFKNWKPKADTDPGNTDFMMSVPRYESYDLDPKQDKMRKLKQKEDRNWMFVAPGELTEEEEGKMGVLDDTSDPKDEDVQNLMFRGLIKEKVSTQDKVASRPGQPGNRNNKNAPPPPVKDDEDDDIGRTLRSSLGLTAKAESTSSAAPTDKQAEFQKLFAAPGSSAREEERADMDVYRSGTSLNMTKSQISSREEFRSFLSGPAGNSVLGSSSDSLNLRPDSKAPGLGGILNRPAEPLRGSRGVDSFAPRTSESWDTLGRMDMNSGGISGFGTLTPRAPAATTPKPFSTPSFDTRARGLNSLGGHK